MSRYHCMCASCCIPLTSDGTSCLRLGKSIGNRTDVCVRVCALCLHGPALWDCLHHHICRHPATSGNTSHLVQARAYFANVMMAWHANVCTYMHTYICSQGVAMLIRMACAQTVGRYDWVRPRCKGAESPLLHPVSVSRSGTPSQACLHAFLQMPHGDRGPWLV